MARHPWCEPQEGSGGVKLHTMYDIMRRVPRMCLITGHEERDQTFMEDYPYEKGCFYVFDKAYMKAVGMWRVNTARAYFVVRRKRNVRYDVVRAMKPSDDVKVMADQAIRFTAQRTSKLYPKPLRMVTYYAEEINETLQFLTNNFRLPAETIALLYRKRWEIELFFRWIKQNLRIVSFYGNSANAIMIQIYTAITSFCALAIAAEKCAYKGSLYDFSNMISVSLTERAWISDIAKRRENCRDREGENRN